MKLGWHGSTHEPCHLPFPDHLLCARDREGTSSWVEDIDSNRRGLLEDDICYEEWVVLGEGQLASPHSRLFRSKGDLEPDKDI